ncbi:MAG TPA: DUF1376 domain-containing protein [Acidobacteriaceae bacterium]|jgi:hypothetical protein
MFDKSHAAERPIRYPYLVGNAAARHFEMEALAAMDAAPLLPSSAASLATAVIMLARDRNARIALAAAPMTGNPGIFFEELEFLNVAEAGAYAILIANAWRTGPLPLDPVALQRETGLSDEQFAHARVPLRAFFDQTRKGWVHRRIEAERIFAIEHQMGRPHGFRDACQPENDKGGL